MAIRFPKFTNPKPTRRDQLNIRAGLSWSDRVIWDDLMEAYEEVPAGGAGDPLRPKTGQPSMARQLFGVEGGYGCIVIPPDVFTGDVLAFAERIRQSVVNCEPARTPLHRAIYVIIARLADHKVRVTPEALALGVLLAAAHVGGTRIKTHPRDLAKEAHVRYAVLLKVRKIAIEVFKSG